MPVAEYSAFPPTLKFTEKGEWIHASYIETVGPVGMYNQFYHRVILLKFKDGMTDRNGDALVEGDTIDVVGKTVLNQVLSNMEDGENFKIEYQGTVKTNKGYTLHQFDVEDL